MRHGLFRSSMILPQPLWSQVVFASHFDGTGTTITDLKGSTVTAYGTATQSTAVKKFGNASLYVGAEDMNHTLVVTNLTTSTLLAYGGDFTVECWYYQQADTEYNFSVLISRTNNYDRTAASSSFELGVSYAGGTYKPILNVFNTSTGNMGLWPSTGVIALNTWNHVAVCRNGNTLRLWSNGVLSGYRNDLSGTISIPPIMPHIGSSNYRHSFRGYIDDVRIIHGRGLYTAPFIPPTSPFPNS
jgi:hypothetical protein